MLTINLNGNNIPLAADFSMQLTWESPVCDFEKIPSGYGLGISFPINEYTRTLFGNPERFSKYRKGDDQKMPGFEVRFSGVLLMAGSLKITSTSTTAYEATLIDQLGVLAEKEAERSILEIPEMSEQIAWENSTNFDPDTHPYCCIPIVNGSFFQDKGVSITRKVWVNGPEGAKETSDTYETDLLSFLFNKSVGSRVNSLSPAGTVEILESTINIGKLEQKGNSYETGQVSVVSPFFYLNYIIKKALKTSKFFLNENVLDTDSTLRRLCIYNPFDITVTEFYYLQILVAAVSQYATVDSEPWGINKVYDITSKGRPIVDYVRSGGSSITIKNHLPKIKVGELLLSTQNLFNLCFHFLPNSTINVLSRESILTSSATEVVDLESYFLGQWAIGEKKQVALNFIREHDKDDLVFQERFNDLNDRRSDIKSPVDGWDDLFNIPNPEEGEIRYLTNQLIYCEYKWMSQSKTDDGTKVNQIKDVLGWEEISIGLQNGWYEYGREEVEEIKTKWSTCYGNATITLANQQGTQNTWKSKNHQFAPRLLLNAENNTGGNRIASLSLEYENAVNGILPVYWRNWNPFWANRLAVTGEFILPLNVLQYLILNICQKYRTSDGEFLIEEMSCELFLDRIGTTQIKGFKV